MSHTIGSKGQLVIEKGIREKLGVRPGFRAVQIVSGDHVEIFFVPPEHTRSLRGAAKALATRTPATTGDETSRLANEIALEFGVEHATKPAARAKRKR